MISIFQNISTLWASTLCLANYAWSVTWLSSVSNGECTCSESLTVKSLSKVSEPLLHLLLPMKDRNSLNSIVIFCSKITGIQQKDLSSLWEKRVIQKAKGIIRQLEHILHIEFTVIKANCNYCSFIPSALKLLTVVDAQIVSLLTNVFEITALLTYY